MSPPARGAWIEIERREGTGEGRTSPPARGAWIEIAPYCSTSSIGTGRPPRGGRGLKLLHVKPPLVLWKSPPARGAWIEIGTVGRDKMYTGVAPREGGVD